MSYDERLAHRIRAVLSGRDDVTERKMFGGIAFLVRGRMGVGVLQDRLLVRTGADRYEEASRRPGARPMDFTGRVSRSMLYVDPPAVSRKPALERWVALGVAAAESAPVTRPRSKPPTVRRR